MKVGILGGRFDPPHLGHLAAAKFAQKRYDLDEVWFVPCNKGNLRKDLLTSAHDRVRMLKLLTNNNFRVSELDIIRGGTTYTIDTIRDLKKKYPRVQFYFIVGEELVSELPRWKKWEKLKKEIKFLKVKKQGFKKIPKISSSLIREKVKKGLSIKGMVTEGIEHYIDKHKLYK